MSILQFAAFQGLCCLAALVGGGSLALADPLDPRLLGAWATSASECSTLFEKSDGEWKYRAPVDKFAQAAIFQPGELLVPAAVCRILDIVNTENGIAIKAECNDSVSIHTQSTTIKI